MPVDVSEEGPDPLTISGLTKIEYSCIILLIDLLREARTKRANGKLSLELDMYNGGVTSKWSSTRYRESPHTRSCT